jgi:anti-anti-sigma factor
MDKTPSVSLSLVELDGEYDLSQKELLASLFGTLRANAPATIDLTKVTYVDSTFLNALAVLRGRFKGYAITLLGANATVLRALRLVGFDRLFELAD